MTKKETELYHTIESMLFRIDQLESIVFSDYGNDPELYPPEDENEPTRENILYELRAISDDRKKILEGDLALLD